MHYDREKSQKKEKVDHGMVSLHRCMEIGKEFKMKASDTILCIK